MSFAEKETFRLPKPPIFRAPVSGRSLPWPEAASAETTGKVSSRTPVVGSPEESDGNIVPEKSTNKGTAVPAESMEGRTPTKRNSDHEAASRMQSRKVASSGLDRVRQRAEADKTFRFTNLFHFLKVDLLRASFRSVEIGPFFRFLIFAVDFKIYGQI